VKFPKKLIYRRTPGSNWLYQFKVNGVRKNGSTGTPDERSARRIAEKLYLEAAAKRSRARGAVPTVSEAMLSYIERNGTNTKHFRCDERALSELANALGPDQPITAIDEDALLEVIDAKALSITRRGKPPSGATINRTIGQLYKRVWHHANLRMKVDGLPKIDWSEVMVPETGARNRVLMDAELLTFRSVAEHDRGYWDAVQFCLLMGLRRRNLAELMWDQVHLDDGHPRYEIIQKGGRRLTGPLEGPALALIKEQTGRHPTHVFAYTATRTGTEPRSGRMIEKGKNYPISYEGLKSWFVRRMTEAGIKDVCLHDLRRTAGSKLLFESGGNMALVSKTLGHSSITTTERCYAFLGHDAHREGLRKAYAAKSEIVIQTDIQQAHQSETTQKSPVKQMVIPADGLDLFPSKQ
jgi:integrase